MSALVVAALGLVGTLVGWRAMRPMFATPVLERRNYRDRALPVATGLVVVIVVAAVAGGVVFVAAVFDRPEATVVASCVAAAVLALGLGLLGFLDDVVGSGADRGLRGHLRALGRGHLTTGTVKLIGTPLVALVALAVTGPIEAATVLDAAVIAAAANLGNLFDRAPGRVVKVTSVATLLVAPAAVGAAFAGPALIAAAGAGMLPVDLAEDGMLGDTGSNVLGAGLGLALVVAFAGPGTWIALGVLVALNLASEFVSFSRVIDATPPLRALDRLGRRRD